MHRQRELPLQTRSPMNNGDFQIWLAGENPELNGELNGKIIYKWWKINRKL